MTLTTDDDGKWRWFGVLLYY